MIKTDKKVKSGKFNLIYNYFQFERYCFLVSVFRTVLNTFIISGFYELFLNVLSLCMLGQISLQLSEGLF